LNNPLGGHGRRRGFTLIELLVVMTIIAILLTVAVPRYMSSVDNAKEAALKTSLARLREAIDQYHSDKGQYPASLETLVESGYMRAMPVDPFTDSAQTWVTSPPPGVQQDPAIFDVHSGASGSSKLGKEYSKW
jgi:general secretion pathway protein G